MSQSQKSQAQQPTNRGRHTNQSATTEFAQLQKRIANMIVRTLCTAEARTERNPLQLNFGKMKNKNQNRLTINDFSEGKGR